MRSNDILLRLSAFLIGGDYTYASERRLERLAPTTVTSYKSFVRKFMETIIQGLVQGHGEGMWCGYHLFILLFSFI